MKEKNLSLLLALFVVCQFVISPIALAEGSRASDNVVMTALQKELDRSFTKLKSAGDAPLYFLAYRLYDTESLDLISQYGALNVESYPKRLRTLELDLRVGDPKLDNTHKIRGGNKPDLSALFPTASSAIPLEDNEMAIRAAVWAKTDSAFKTAQKHYAAVKANEDLQAPEEDKSGDFSSEKPSTYIGEPTLLKADRDLWISRLKQLSAIYRQYPHIYHSRVDFSATHTHRYLVTSEGTKIDDEGVQYRLSTSAEALADDGMRVWLYDGVEARTSEELPDEQAFAKTVNDLAQSLTKLAAAPPAEPFTGPAILNGKAAAVYFHETLGHRIEGHRQKDMEEGRTFAKKLGQQIMPDFISVIDDPTCEKLKSKTLNGFYTIDDEGVPAQKVTLVDHGVLKTFLCGRSPIKGCAHSNGHGRCAPGYQPTARQGNLMVQASKSVPYSELRQQLIAEAKRQGKPYGLIFDQIAGGFTITQTMMPQSFKLLPLMVTRVYVDGKPDEVVRGVDLVGTPLTSLENIIQAGDDPDTFNGTCGAESGWVPVSATSPSLLIKTIEVERKANEQIKPPILQAPIDDKGNKS
jgi:predicted Zn-dependent protease